MLTSSTNLTGAAPIGRLRAGLQTTDQVPGRIETFRLLVRPIVSGESSLWLIVGVNNDDVTDSISILSRLLAVVVPIVVVVLSALIWCLIGRTLRPVEKMRVEIAEITGSNLDDASPSRRLATRSIGWRRR